VIKYSGFGRKEMEYKNECGKTDSFKYAPSVGVYDMSLKSGSKYCIIPCTSEPTTGDFTLSVWSSKKITLHEINNKWEHIATRRSAWRGETAAGSPNESNFTDNPQFLLTFPQGKRTEFVVDLTVGDDSDAMGFVVVERDNDKPKKRLTAGKVTNDNIYLQPEGFLAQVSVSKYGTVTENAAKDHHYIIIPSTFKPGVERTFRLTVYSDNEVVLDRLTEDGVASEEVDELSSEEESEEEDEEDDEEDAN